MEEALPQAATFRLEFDRPRLRSLIGDTAFATLTPGSREIQHPFRYDVLDAKLDPSRAALLRDFLAEEVADAESPWTSIRSLRLLDEAGGTLVRFSDHGTFLLFELPEHIRRQVAERLAELGLEDDVLDEVDVDPSQLAP